MKSGGSSRGSEDIRTTVPTVSVHSETRAITNPDPSQFKTGAIKLKPNPKLKKDAFDKGSSILELRLKR